MTSRSDWRYPLLERCALWRSKHLPWQGWRRICKRVVWMTHLSGRMLKPSTAKHGVDVWISSLADTRVNRSLSPANAMEQAIRGTYGRMWRESFGKYDRPCAFSRTSQGILDLGLEKSKELSKDLATELRAESSVRRKSGRTIGESGYSLWPTATANKLSGSTREDFSVRLTEKATQWRTPRASDGEGGIMEMREGADGHYKLRDHAANWRTPLWTDGEKQGHGNLANQANWQTPKANDAEKRGDFDGADPRNGLAGQGRTWPSPKARDYKSGSGAKLRNSPDLDKVAESWPTPRTTDMNSPGIHGTGGADLRTTVASHPPLTQHKHGEIFCEKTRHLNPRFVEALMGWPGGWTDYGFSVTELSPWLEHWRSYVYGVVSRKV